jgi:hypothetical protein
MDDDRITPTHTSLADWGGGIYKGSGLLEKRKSPLVGTAYFPR